MIYEKINFKNNEALIGYDIYQKINLKLNDLISIKNNNQEYKGIKIVGVFKTGNQLIDNYIIVSKERAQDFLGYKRYELIPISIENYLNQKNEFKEKIYKTIENKMIGKNLTKMIEFEKIYSIDDFKKDYNVLQGTALGIIHDLKQTLFRPKNQSKKLKNLYYVGGYVNPGIGMSMILASAQIVYKKILNIKKEGPLTSI